MTRKPRLTLEHIIAAAMLTVILIGLWNLATTPLNLGEDANNPGLQLHPK